MRTGFALKSPRLADSSGSGLNVEFCETARSINTESWESPKAFHQLARSESLGAEVCGPSAKPLGTGTDGFW